jgi:hypothetical protein
MDNNCSGAHTLARDNLSDYSSSKANHGKASDEELIRFGEAEGDGLGGVLA